MLKHNIVIIGGGPAAMAAAVAAWDSGQKDVVILEREDKLGGILQQCIHNGFGLHKLGVELTGPEYADVYCKEVKKRNIKAYCSTVVTSISNKKVITAQNKNGILKIKAKAVILAMGCRERSRGALNICGNRPSGIYSAGTAQKLINCYGFHVGKKIVILGSGDIGLIMARRLTLQGAKVEAVCELMHYSSGLKRNITQCLDDFDIPLYLSTTVINIHGKQRVEGVTVAQVDGNKNVVHGTERFIPCDTLLLSVGLIPENELARQMGIRIDGSTGGAHVDQYRQTNIAGVFACGNVLQVHDLVDYVSDEAQIAGEAAAKYCKGELRDGKGYNVIADYGIKYVVPQVIRPTDGNVTLYFRVTKPCQNVKISVKVGNETLTRVARTKVSPGEMEKITLSASKMATLNEDVTVSLEEEE